MTTTIGFIGGAGQGLATARRLLAAGFTVVCARGDGQRDLITAGAEVPGDGSPQAVADAADIVLTHFTTARAFEQIAMGPHGILASEHLPPLIEMSSTSLRRKNVIRRSLIDRRIPMVDAPLSGTSEMVTAGQAAIYVSGDRDLYCTYGDVLHAMSPHATYVGSFGEGTRAKFVALFVCAVEATGARGHKRRPGLNLYQLTKRSGICPFMMSERLHSRAARIAAYEFHENSRAVGLQKNVANVIDYGREIPAPEELLSVLRSEYLRLSADSDCPQQQDLSDPARQLTRSSA